MSNNLMAAAEALKLRSAPIKPSPTTASQLAKMAASGTLGASAIAAMAQKMYQAQKPIQHTYPTPQLSPRTNMQKIQNAIKVERMNQHMTQRQLAAKSGKSQGTITRIERHGWTSIWTLFAVVEALGKELILN